MKASLYTRDGVEGLVDMPFQEFTPVPMTRSICRFSIIVMLFSITYLDRGDAHLR
jgi:hypothetical protein